MLFSNNSIEVPVDSNDYRIEQRVAIGVGDLGAPLNLLNITRQFA